MSVERLGSALARIEDFIGDVCDEDLELLDDWLDEAQDAVHREQRKRRTDHPDTTGETETRP